MEEMLKRSYSQPWLQISQEGTDIREKLSRFLHACYYPAEEIDQWFAIVNDAETSDENREEKLEEFLPSALRIST